MELRSRFAAALGLAVVLSPVLARGDDGEVPPPPLPASQMPAPTKVASDLPQGWLPNAAQASKSLPAASPQSITVPVAAAPAPVQAPAPAAPQTVSFQVQLVPTPAAPAPMVAAPAPAPSSTLQVAHSQAPGPIGRAVGKVGNYLTRAGMTKLYVPAPQIQQVVYTTTSIVQVPPQTFFAAPATVAVPVAVPVSASAQAPVPVQASAQATMPAAPRKGWLHR